MRKQLMARLAVLATLAGLAIVAGPASPAHAFIGIYRVSAVSAANGVSPKSVTASCNAGDDLLSVGGRINNGGADVILPQAYADAALTTGVAWGIESIPTAAAWSVEIFITCVPGGTVTNLQLEETTLGPNVNDKFVLASCDAGQFTYGAGFRLNGAFGAVAIDEVRFGSNLDYVVVQSYDYVAPPSYSLTGQAICGDPVPTMVRQTFLSANNAISPKTESINACPAGTQVSGVGGMITGALGAVSLTMLNPRPQLLAGEVTAREIGPFGGNWTVEAQEVCVG